MINQNTKRMVSIFHGTTELADPIGASWSSPVEWKKNKPATTIANEAICIDDVDLTAQAKFQGLATPITQGTQDDLTLTMEQFDGNDAEVLLPDMLAGSSAGDMMGAIHYQTQDFKYQGTDLTPQVVTLV